MVEVIAPGAFDGNVGKVLPVRGPDGTIIGRAEIVQVNETPNGPELVLDMSEGADAVRTLFVDGELAVSIGPLVKDPEHG